jgi:general secretion pathway protein I
VIGTRLHRGGFTLLEVMVAVAILGLGLTAILSAQAGVFASASHARNISVATGLLRCKMTELEEQLAREGFQELDVNESGVCCEGDETPDLTCSWKIEKPQLPEGKFGELDLNAALGSDQAGGLAGLLTGGTANSSAPPLVPPDGNLSDVAKRLAGDGNAAPGGPDLGSVAAGGIGGIASMVMSLVYPSLKLLFEASTRRVTVTLTWREGKKEYPMEVVQWVASPQRAGVTGEGGGGP